MAVALLAGAVSAYSQGQIAFSDYGNSDHFAILIFNTQAAASVPVTYNGYTATEVQGNPTAAAYPQTGTGSVGTTVYAANSALTGTGYDLQLLGAPGASQPLSALVPDSVVITSGFGTVVGSTAGIFNESATVTTLGTITPPGAATVAIACWVNNGVDGAAATLATAQADGYAWGISTLGNVVLTTTPNSPPVFPTTITAFSLGTVPEPSTIALGVIGASAFLMRLRRKN